MLATFTLKSVPPQLVKALFIFVLPITILVLYGWAVKALLFAKASKTKFAAWFLLSTFAIIVSMFFSVSNFNDLIILPAITLVFCGWHGFSWLKLENKQEKQSEDKTTFSQKEADDLWLNPPMKSDVITKRILKITFRIVFAIILGITSFILIWYLFWTGAFYNWQGI